MPALMAKRSSSERCAIRRELHRRRKLAASSKGGIVKKSSANQSSAFSSSADEPAGPATKKPSSMTMPMPRPRSGVAMSPASIPQHAPAAVATKKQLAAVAKEIAASVPPGQVAKRCTAPPRRSALIPTASGMKMKVMPSAATRPRSPVVLLLYFCSACFQFFRPNFGQIFVKIHLKFKFWFCNFVRDLTEIFEMAEFRPSRLGAKKNANRKPKHRRTHAGILPTGHCLLLWLAARVVSDAADDGYVHVIYDGNFPRDDPLRTVRVAMDDVRSMPAIVQS
ncbi:hypothetical protein VPH35_093331 [Triticum aestivum]